MLATNNWGSATSFGLAFASFIVADLGILFFLRLAVAPSVAPTLWVGYQPSTYRKMRGRRRSWRLRGRDSELDAGIKNAINLGKTLETSGETALYTRTPASRRKLLPERLNTPNGG